MNEQLSLFGNGMLSVVDGGMDSMSNDAELLKCFKSELQSIDYLSVEDLFSGFNTIHAITFSYDVKFINELMTHFDYGEIILGGNFLVQKDAKLNDLLAEICTNAYETGILIKKYDRLVEMLTNGEIELKTPTFVLDHRKIYLLKADDGRTRVIKASANMSSKAWNNDHIEHYEYDDSPLCYDEYMKDFETAWTMSNAITPEVISSKKSNDKLEGNAILKGIKETGQAIVLQQPESDISFDNIKYTIDHEAIREEYKVLLDGVNPKNTKSGMFEITPKNIQKIEYNKKKLFQKKVKVNHISEKYPSLTLDLCNEEAFLNGEPVDVNPTEEDVKQDIEVLFEMFHNFDSFVTADTDRLKEIHFKLMNAIFSSLFNARFRCAAKIKGISPSSLPMFALISSETSNSGKTFMIRAALKMMTGKELDGVKSCDCSKDNIRTTQLGVKGVPFFVDEIDNAYISRIKDIIKNSDKCEDNQLEEMPMIVFASNDVLKPEEPIRKRMIFFSLDGALPSSIDKTAYESKGKAIIRKLGTGFYREYLKRMMKQAKEELDFIVCSNEISDEYYPDLMRMSSLAIISILQDYGYEVPPYIKELTWEKDYSCDSNADEALQEIEQFWKRNRKACTVTKNEVIIELGTDKNSQKKVESWKNILPAEMKATVQTTRECSKISIDRNEIEERLGHGFGRFPFFRRE